MEPDWDETIAEIADLFAADKVVIGRSKLNDALQEAYDAGKRDGTDPCSRCGGTRTIRNLATMSPADDNPCPACCP